MFLEANDQLVGLPSESDTASELCFPGALLDLAPRRSDTRNFLLQVKLGAFQCSSDVCSNPCKTRLSRFILQLLKRGN
ncbi:MAG: hypothetical protein KDK08_28605, partial [Rhizobiaceae bacterium]|nr:hypothetical protein [Rhizobiaceae bacterium]